MDSQCTHVYTFIWIFVTVLICISSISSTKIDEKTPSLAPLEKYRDLFPLTERNFTEKLLNSKDVWIVIFHNGSVDMQWKTMATHLRGISWVGLIDTTVELRLVKQLEINVQTEIARVYPYGTKSTKIKKWRAVKDQNEARQVAVSTLVDPTLLLRPDTVEPFIQDALMSTPSRFPVYYISDDDDTPGLMKAVSLRFEKYFIFGRVIKPSREDLQKLGLGNKYITRPSIFVIVFQDASIDKINAIEFSTSKNGQMNYTNIMQFLFGINTEFRYQLPGNNQANNKETADMDDIILIEEGRFSFLFPDNEYSATNDVKHNSGLTEQDAVTSQFKDEL